MKKVLGTFITAVCIGIAPCAWAQDANTQTPGFEQTPSIQTPSNQTDTSSPLTPTNPNTATPLTPTPTNPVSGQQQTTSAGDSSSEPPATFNQSPTETNRVDPAAPSSLSLQIDPSSSASLLNPDSASSTPSSLVPTDPGVSLGSVQQTTTLTMPGATTGSSTMPSPLSANPYPAIIAEPTSTQTFLSNLSAAASEDIFLRSVGRSRSTSMGPLIGSAAVNRASAIETMSTSPTAAGSSTFMRSLRSSTLAPSIGSTSFGRTQIGSSSFGSISSRPSFGRMSSTSGSHSMSGGHR